MQLNIVGRNVEVTPALDQFVKDKLSTISERFKQITHVHVILQVDKIQQKAEATVHLSGKELFAEATTEDMYQSIEALIDKLTAQLTKHKEKQTDHHPHD